MRNCLLSNTLEVGITRDNSLTCLSASANGSVLADRHEAQAVADVFQGAVSHLPVTAVKSMLGETLGASGAMQTVTLLVNSKML